MKRTGDGTTVVAPLRITQSAKGTKLAELRPAAAERSAVDERDQRVCEALTSVREFGTGAARGTARALEALVGHPRVFVERRPVRVVRETPQLTLAEREGRLHLAFAIGERTVAPKALLDAMVDDRTAAFLDGSHEGLVSLARVTFEVQTLARFERLAPNIDVALPKELTGEPVAADERCLLRIDAVAFPVLVVSIRVRPLAHAAVHIPGEGATSLHGRDENGKLVHTLRALDRERETAEQLAASLAIPSTSRSESDALTYETRSPRESGELLGKIRALEAEPSVVVEWSGSPPVVSTVSQTDLRVRVVERRDWFGIGGEIEVDGTELAMATLLEAARRKERFVVVGPGKLVELAEDLRAKLAALDDHVRTARDGTLELASTAAPAITDFVAQLRQELPREDEAFLIDASFSSGEVAPIGVLIYLKLKSPRAKDRADVIELLEAGFDQPSVAGFLDEHAPELRPAFDAAVAAARAEEEA